MIVSKAMRNIRQKIDWSMVNANPNTTSGLWQFDFQLEARDERLDYAQSRGQDVNFVSVVGGTITDDDWHSLFGSLGDAFSVASLISNMKTLRPELTLVTMLRSQANARINQEYTGRYLCMDFTYGNQLPNSNFTSIMACVANQYVSTLTDSVSMMNIFEISYQDLLNMGVPLVNNGDGTYKINIGVDRFRIKISEDV